MSKPDEPGVIKLNDEPEVFLQWGADLMTWRSLPEEVRQAWRDLQAEVEAGRVSD